MGITISDWAIVLATAVSPLAAVLISLWIEQRRATRATRQGLLYNFLNTMHHPQDANYQMAIRAVAVEFRRDREVMGAHREFMDAANLGSDLASALTQQKLTKLVAILFSRVGSKVSEDDVRGLEFVSVGFAKREKQLEDALMAVKRIADALDHQLELLRSIQK